jgi:uncharacterized FlaG/YvyC family protein
MDINAISRSLEAPHAPTPSIPLDKAAENRDVVQAVKAVNGTGMFGQDSELMFQRDPLTQRMVLQLIDRKTGEVLSQIPRECLLRLAADLKPSNGKGPNSR